MNSRERRAQRYRDKCTAERRFATKVATALSGCTERTLKAIGLPAMKEAEPTGSICIPDVAKYQAGHRKIRENATHITR